MSIVRKGFVICLLVTMVVAVGCVGSEVKQKEPPNAIGLVDGQTIPFLTGSYIWKRTVADAPNPTDLVNGAEGYTVKPNAQLVVTFEGKAPNKVTVGIWTKQDFVPLPTVKGKILLPSEPGRYVLVATGEWRGGDHGSYAVVIEVKE